MIRQVLLTSRAIGAACAVSFVLAGTLRHGSVPAGLFATAFLLTGGLLAVRAARRLLAGRSWQDSGVQASQPPAEAAAACAPLPVSGVAPEPAARPEPGASVLSPRDQAVQYWAGQAWASLGITPEVRDRLWHAWSEPAPVPPPHLERRWSEQTGSFAAFCDVTP